MVLNVDSLPTIAANDGSQFPVRRILCVAKNYRAHAIEMGSDPDREPPTFFDKPIAALATSQQTIPYPRGTKELHHEVELVIAIGMTHAGPVTASQASMLVYGAACGVDLTKRDLQSAAKGRGGPWDLAKGFVSSAPVGSLARMEVLPTAGRIRLSVNDEVRQDSDLSHMIWSANEVLAHYSEYDDLLAGDLIFTGTPAGVGALVPGDHIEAAIEGLPPLRFNMSP